jgi:hypothetical protein
LLLNVTFVVPQRLRTHGRDIWSGLLPMGPTEGARRNSDDMVGTYPPLGGGGDAAIGKHFWDLHDDFLRK